MANCPRPSVAGSNIFLLMPTHFVLWDKNPVLHLLRSSYLSANITFLDIIHGRLYLKCLPVYISKHNVSDTGFCLRLQVKPTHKGMVRSDMLKPALIFFFTTRVHTTKSTDKILAAKTHCKYFLKIAEVTHFFCTRNRLYQRFIQSFLAFKHSRDVRALCNVLC
jgi:hypothetical protein